MAPRPDDWMVEVELVEDDRSSAVVPSADRAAVDQSATADDQTGPTAERPGWRRGAGRVCAGAAALAVLVVGVSVVRDLGSGPDPDASGVPLDHPLAELWSVPGGVVLGSADGVVAILATGAVTGIDEVTGEERWSLVLGEGAGPTSCGATITTEPGTLWCRRNRTGVVDGGTGDVSVQQAAIIGLSMTDGAVVAQHEVRLPSAGMLAIEGDLVVGERAGPILTLQRIEPHGWVEVWRSAVELEPDVALGQFDAEIAKVGESVVVRGPTVVVVDPADGDVLVSWPPIDDPIRTGIDAADLVMAAHGFAASAETVDGVRLERGVWYDAEGNEVVGFDGVLAEPAASDGSDPGVLLVSRSRGTVLAGVDVATGDDLWTFRLDGGATLARQEGTVVVMSGESRLTCLELLTGWVVWTAEVAGLRTDAGGVSDGETAVVLAVQERRWVMDAYSVATGELLWFADAPQTPDLNELFFAGGPPRLGLLGDRPVIEYGRRLTWLG